MCWETRHDTKNENQMRAKRDNLNTWPFASNRKQRTLASASNTAPFALATRSVRLRRSAELSLLISAWSRDFMAVLSFSRFALTSFRLHFSRSLSIQYFTNPLPTTENSDWASTLSWLMVRAQNRSVRGNFQRGFCCPEFLCDHHYLSKKRLLMAAICTPSFWLSSKCKLWNPLSRVDQHKRSPEFSGKNKCKSLTNFLSNSSSSK